MNTKSAWITVVGVVVGGVLLALTSSQSAVGQLGATVPGVGARYQMVVQGLDQDPTVFVLDTATGRVWHRKALFDNTVWIDLGVPAERAKPAK